jgi:hypothetical protein
MTILQAKKCLRRWANATHRSLGGMRMTPFWGSKAAALYAQYQHSVGLPATGIRDVATNSHLKFWLHPGRVYGSPSQQAHNPYTGNLGVESVHMRDVWKWTAKRLRACGVTVRVAADWSALEGSAGYMNAVRDSNAWKPDVHVPTHSNAGAPGSVGTVTFYRWGSAPGKRLAGCLQRHVAPVSPGADHGVRAQAGWAELYVNATVGYIEIAYHSNLADAKSIVQHPAVYGYALADGILEYLTK